MTFYRMNNKSCDNENQWDKYFNQFFSDTPFWNQKRPPVDILEQENQYLLTAELPGFAPEQIDIQVVEGRLQLKATAKKEDGRYLIKERNQGNIERSFALPKDADTESINAAYSNGLLNLTIGRKKPKSQKIKIDF